MLNKTNISLDLIEKKSRIENKLEQARNKSYTFLLLIPNDFVGNRDRAAVENLPAGQSTIFEFPRGIEKSQAF